MTISRLKTYSELQKLPTFIGRFDYLRLKGEVGQATFGFNRYLNQELYKSAKWLRVREEVIIRDNGCDLGLPGYEIIEHIVVHHMNPITMEDIEFARRCVFNIDNLICVSPRTHRAIHYGDESLLPRNPIVRRPGDTTPWR